MKRQCVIIGAPDDRGVAIVGGRVGAAQAPSAIRSELRKCGAGDFLDEGDIPVEGTQDQTYQLLRQKIYSFHKAGKFPILLGGGHDLSFGSLSGFLDAYPKGGVVNIDPHLDARPVLKEGEYSSGSAYRLLLEKGLLEGKRLMEFGYQLHCNAPAHLEFLQKRGVRLVEWPGDFEKSVHAFSESVSALAVSFDMDSIRSDFAPGVSAPAKVGYTADETLHLIGILKKIPNLKQFEVMEVNPRFDSDGRTANLAARLILEILTNVVAQ